MTNQQLTQNVIELLAFKAKAEEENNSVKETLQDLKEDIQATKTLTEDVHIMAINMKNMQKVQEDMCKKIDDLSSTEFYEYKENKKLIKQKILSMCIGAAITSGLGFISWLVGRYIMKGGM